MIKEKENELLWGTHKSRTIKVKLSLIEALFTMSSSYSRGQKASNLLLDVFFNFISLINQKVLFVLKHKQKKKLLNKSLFVCFLVFQRSYHSLFPIFRLASNGTND